MSGIKRIAKRATIVGGGTFISRVLGYVRDAAIASYFGAGLAADTFFVAFRIANLLRRLAPLAAKQCKWKRGGGVDVFFHTGLYRDARKSGERRGQKVSLRIQSLLS
ncbi:MAG: lipid II flippase MurJ [Thermodesulfobacteriota bacterium]